MIATITLVPGTYWAGTDNVGDAKLNLTANPTIVATVTFADGKADAVVSATTKTFATFDLANDILRVVAGHDASVGQRVKVSSATTLPAGLSASYEYFLRPDVSNPTTDFTLHYTLAGAQNNTDRVDVTDAGTGVHTLTYYSYATGAPFIYDSAGLTWEKGIVSAENLPEYTPATASTPGVRGAVPAHEPANLTDYLTAAGWSPFPTLPDFSAAGLFTYLNLN